MPDGRLGRLLRVLRGRRAGVLAGAAVALLIGVAIIVVAAVGKRQPGPAISPFIQQTDGKFGYAMLRPASWTAVSPSKVLRGYRDAKNVADARLVLTVRNIAVSTLEGDMDASLFADVGTLDAWTTATEERWRHDHVEFIRLQTLPNARIYATRLTGTTEAGATVQRVDLIAYVVDQGQPLMVGLGGSGDHPLEPLERLQAEGAIDGFVTMVKSLRAIPADPGNVSPPLD